jgi:menaquinone-dependent protoporphyrinogen IX oxidase
MENVVVVYKSRTGFTDGYAHWIAEELGCEIYPLENVNLVNFSPFDMVIFGGGVRAGKIDGIHFIKKALKSCPEKQLVVFATGAAPQEDTEAAKRVQQGNIPANVEIPFFYFQSGINYERMKGVDKLIMSVVRMIMRGMKEKEGSDQMVQAMKNSYDYSSRGYIEPLISYVRNWEDSSLLIADR